MSDIPSISPGCLLRRVAAVLAAVLATACASSRQAPGVPAHPTASPSETSAARAWDFEDEPTGQTPRGFTVPTGRWQLVPDHTSRDGGTVLGQLERNPDDVFNVVLVDGTSYGDVDISVRLRSIAGDVDQGGGLVWRASDARNYYIARYNPLEGNFRVYDVLDGRRRQLGSASIDVDHQAWHTLHVRMLGDHIECSLDGVKHLDVHDGTFTAAGGIGLWTKADAQTHFDDLDVSAPLVPIDVALVSAAVGTQASAAPDGAVRVSWARTEVDVRIDGTLFPPAAGLTSWAGFAPAVGGAVLMGDTVVFQDEVGPAMDAAFAHGLEVTALHNHFFYDEPKVYFMHIGGHGDPTGLARGVKAVWDAVREVRRGRPDPASTFPEQAPPVAGGLDAGAIQAIVGVEPTVKDGVVKLTVAREASMHAARFGGSMGLTTWAAFTGSDAWAAIDGDFAMTAAEVQPVLRALRQAGVHVVALHNHMIGEEPAYFFNHYWARGSAADLARGFRAALDAQREPSPGGPS